MKLSKLSFTFLVAPMLLGCQNANSNPKSGDPVLKSISLSGTYQTEFTVNDAFNYDGLVVTANYDDDSFLYVTPDSVSSPDMSTAGEKEVVVTYKTKSASYTITVSEEEPEYNGYIALEFSNIDIALNDGKSYYLNPRAVDYEPNPDLNMPFTFESSDDTIATVTHNGGIKSAKNKTGTCTITVTGDTGLTAKCTVNVLETLPVKEKAYVQLTNYDSLKDGDILVMAAPTHGVTASLDTLHSKLNPATSTFSSDLKKITSLGEGTIEFVLGIEDRGMTLESQTGEYLKCTHQGKVTLDSSLKTNRFWDIHSNVDPDTGEGSVDDGAVIENDVESLGYFMFNVPENYFTTYVDNSIRPNIMELPFLYRLEYID